MFGQNILQKPSSKGAQRNKQLIRWVYNGLFSMLKNVPSQDLWNCGLWCSIIPLPLFSQCVDNGAGDRIHCRSVSHLDARVTVGWRRAISFIQQVINHMRACARVCTPFARAHTAVLWILRSQILNAAAMWRMGAMFANFCFFGLFWDNRELFHIFTQMKTENNEHRYGQQKKTVKSDYFLSMLTQHDLNK